MTPLSVSDELLIVVPVEALHAARLVQGFDPSPQRILDAACKPGVARVMPRLVAETDPRFKQIVCYVVLRSGGSVFNYRRSAKAGERRLAGLRSIGVGGHLNVGDVGDQIGLDGLRRGISRELAEEVTLAEEPPIRYLGIINDDTTDVGRVHIGLIALAELAEPRVSLRDPTLLDGRFDRPETLVARSSSFEGWSQLCLPALISLPDIS